MPMSRIYLLVQNNVRTGPFTLEELLQQPLHDNGLVWIIGQSEDWLSPLEISSLEPFYFKCLDGTIAVKETVLDDIRFKRFINPLNNEHVDEYRQGVLDAQLLKEVDEIAPQPASVFEESNAPIQNVKNSESAQYESVYAQQERPKARMVVNDKEDDNITIARKNWAVVGVAALLILFITWNAFFNDGARQKRTLADTGKKEQLVENTSFEATTPKEVKAKASGVRAPSSNQVYGNLAPTVSADSFLDSVQRVMDEQDQLMADVDAVYHKSFLYRKRYAHRQTGVASIQNTKKRTSYPIVTKKNVNTASEVPLSQQVDLQSRLIMDKNKQQINAVELKVKNNSRELLKKVSVDVFYYKNGQKLLNKETVYFTNIYPRQLMTMSIASNQRATSARFQLGAVSTGKN